MLSETFFKGSNLQAVISNESDPDKLKTLYSLIKGAKENQPNSIFWGQAFELISNKYKKI